MPNFLEMLRLGSIFGQQAQPAMGDIPPVNFGPQQSMAPMGGIPQMEPEPVPMNNGVQPSVGNRIMEMMNEMYQPEHAASDAFNSSVQNMPQFKEPSQLRKIGGSIMGALTDLGTNFGGNQAGVKGSDVMDRVTGREAYDRSIVDWKNKILPQEKAAQLERTTNVNERTMAYQTVSSQLRAEADAEKSRHNEAGEKVNLMKANLLDFKAKNPTLKFDFTGATVKVANPQTGELKDTGVPTGNMSDAEKMLLNHQYKVEEAHVRGAETRETEEVKQENRTELGWSDPVNIKDPKDPNKVIAVKINKSTGEVMEVKLDGANVGGIVKPGTKMFGHDQPVNLEEIKQKTRDLKAALLDIYNPETGKMTSEASRATGWTSYGNWMPTSQGKSGESRIKRVKDMLVIDLIGEMKKQSRTGATGFGALNLKELNVLEGAASRLSDLGLDEAEYTKELARINERLDWILMDESKRPSVAPDNAHNKPKAADMIQNRRGNR